MGKVKKCCVPGCDDKISKRHRFPKSNPDLLKTWVKIIKPTNWEELTDEQIYNRCYVCHVHFADCYDLPKSNRGLTVDAIPTLRIPGSVDEASESTTSNVLVEEMETEEIDTAEINTPLAETLHNTIHSDCGGYPGRSLEEQFSADVQSKENIVIGPRKYILKKVNYTRKSQLLPKENILFC